MRKFFKSVFSSIGKFFSKVGQLAVRAFSKLATVLRDASIALSGAASSFSYLGATVVATFLGLPFTAATFATFTVLAMWGTVFYREHAEQEKLIRGLYVARAVGVIADVYESASDARRSRHHRRSLRSIGNY